MLRAHASKSILSSWSRGSFPLTVIRCSASGGSGHQQGGQQHLHKNHAAMSAKAKAVADASPTWDDLLPPAPQALPAERASEKTLKPVALSSLQLHFQKPLQPWGLMVAAMAAGVVAGGSLGAIPVAWAGYCRLCAVYPFPTKLATGIMGAFLGDLAAQLVQHKLSTQDQHQPAFDYDSMRTARMIAWSATLATPVGVLWYSFLDQAVMPNAPTSLPAVLSKTALDQMLLTPVMTSAFFGYMAWSTGAPSKAVSEIKTKLLPTLRANYMVWPAAHFINFAFIPGDLRILYINLVAIGWTCFLSLQASKK